MLQSLKDWFKKPYDENAKNIVGNYIKNRLRVLFWMFIFVVILIVVLALDKQFNISKLLGIPCESIYSDERCNK